MGSGTETTQLLRLLQKWVRRWKFIALFVWIPTIAAGILAYTGKKTFTARASMVMEKSQKSAASSILSSLGMGDVSALVGGSNTNSNLVLSLSESRELATIGIKKFRLDTVWELKPQWKPEDGYKLWRKCLSLAPSENNDEVLELEFSDHDPVRATAVVSFVQHWLDSSFISMGMARSGRNLQFIMDRLEKKQVQMDSAEKALRTFLQREKLFIPDERIAMSVRKMAELEASSEALDMQSELLERTQGKQSSARSLVEDQKRMLKAQISKLEIDSKESWVGAPLSKDLNRRFVYEHLLKNLERHATVFKYLVQQEEMLQIDARKDLPVLTVIDPATIPQKKTAPKVLLMIQMVFSMTMSLALLLVTFEDTIKHVLSVLWAEFRRS